MLDNKLFDILFWTLVVIFIIPLLLVALYLKISDHIKWNHGICRKCKSDKLTLTKTGIYIEKDKSFLNNLYTCKSCNHMTKVFDQYKELSKEDTISIIRDRRLKSIL